MYLQYQFGPQTPHLNVSNTWQVYSLDFDLSKLKTKEQPTMSCNRALLLPMYNIYYTTGVSHSLWVNKLLLLVLVLLSVLISASSRRRAPPVWAWSWSRFLSFVLASFMLGPSFCKSPTDNSDFNRCLINKYAHRKAHLKMFHSSIFHRFIRTQSRTLWTLSESVALMWTDQSLKWHHPFVMSSITLLISSAE